MWVSNINIAKVLFFGAQETAAKDIPPAISHEDHEKCNQAIIRGNEAIKALKQKAHLVALVDQVVAGDKAEHELRLLPLFPPTSDKTRINYAVKEKKYTEALVARPAAWKSLCDAVQGTSDGEFVKALEQAKQAKDEIARGYYRYVYRSAGRFRNFTEDLDSLKQEALLKLHELAHNYYDPSGKSQRLTTILGKIMPQFFNERKIALAGLNTSIRRYIVPYKTVHQNLTTAGKPFTEEEIYKGLLQVIQGTCIKYLSWTRFQDLHRYMTQKKCPVMSEERTYPSFVSILSSSQRKFILQYFRRNKPSLLKFFQYHHGLKDNGEINSRRRVPFQIAQKLGISETELPRIEQETSNELKTLFQFLQKPGSFQALYKLLGGELTLNYLRTLDKVSLQKAIVNTRSAPHRLIARLRLFGEKEGSEPMLLREIGHLIKKSRERVRQLEPEVFAKVMVSAFIS